VKRKKSFPLLSKVFRIHEHKIRQENVHDAIDPKNKEIFADMEIYLRIIAIVKSRQWTPREKERE